MRFLHTADWQIGMKATALGEAAARVREERLAAGLRIVEVARQRGADFILVAGDLFEHNGVDRVLVQRVADVLGSFSGPVFIIPGNHDPLTRGSVWEHPAWKGWGNLHILREESPVSVAGGILFPCPVQESHSGRNPTAWIPVERGATIRIGMAHGTVESVRQDEPDYPIPRDAAERSGLDYLALGHWHSAAVYCAADGAPRMAYSGTPEPSGFGERESGFVLLVEIPGPGAPPALTAARTGRLEWTTVAEELRGPGDLTRLRERLEGAARPDAALVEVVLSGLLPAQEQDELARIHQILQSRFFWGKVDAARLRPSPEDDAWIDNLPPGIIREAAMRLRHGKDVSPEVAARALMELYALAGEVRR
ncbi:MAG TPA: DNA repair exonuclease [Syntrophobacteria bacterium]|nr:DNA repair exonuclease [Syntrophobacteria bacterium]